MKALAYLMLFASVLAYADEADYARARAALIEELREYAQYSRNSDEISMDGPVMTAMNTVKRHKLMPQSERHAAYQNRPLPIGYGQTISQPYIVALMTELIEPDDDDVVLEIGTGSGYQAAILAELVKQVYSIEIIPALAIRAKQDLESLGYQNISTRLGDGYFGWEEQAPFDAIVVTAAATHVPPPLVAQMKPGGRMVIPVGSRFMTQQLLLLEKTDDGEVITRQIAPVRFVPLTGEH
jgi:protein-L-isoaspartate(D-aspartate) O-methyltransferase